MVCYPRTAIRSLVAPANVGAFRYASVIRSNSVRPVPRVVVELAGKVSGHGGDQLATTAALRLRTIR
jgi:hypothetical protein